MSILEKYPILSIYKSVFPDIDFNTFKDYTGQVEQYPLFPKLCYSCGRTNVTENRAKYYVEWFIILKDLPIPVGHAWYIDNEGQHIDKTGEHDAYYIGKTVPAEEFIENFKNPEFVEEYEKHDMLPYFRAVLVRDSLLQRVLTQNQRKKRKVEFFPAE